MRPGERFRGLYGLVGGGERPAPADDVLALADALLAAEVRVLQLRDKRSNGRELVAIARALATRAHAKGALFVVNDRLDVALLSGADGVHLGQDDLPIADARSVLERLGRARGDFIVGLSTHDSQQVREAVRLEVDYLGFGPVFRTTTKADALLPRGLARLAEAVREAASVPVVAIGGVGLSNVGEVARSGAAMAAVVSDLAAAADPRARAREIQRAFAPALDAT